MLKRLPPLVALLVLAGPARADRLSPVTSAQMPADIGDVARPAGSNTTTIQPGAVTAGKMATNAAASNLGSAGGDLTGAFPSPTVSTVKGKVVLPIDGSVSMIGPVFGNGGAFAINTALATARPFNAMAEAPFGNATSYCSIVGCPYIDGPNSGVSTAIDHQRAAALFSSITSDDGHSQENTLGIETTIATGQSKPYAASTAYTYGDNIILNGLVYRAISGSAGNSAGTTGANSPPSGYGQSITDGSVTWQWINGSALDAKVGLFNGTSVVAGAGAAWSASFDLVNRKNSTAPITTTLEIDNVNQNSAATLGGYIGYGINIGMTGSTSTAGIQVGSANAAGNFGALFGAWFTGPLGQIADVEIDTNGSPAGLGFNTSGVGGARGSFDIQSKSATPTFLQDVGTHSNISLDLEATANSAIVIGNKYKVAQIIGQGFSFDLSGDLNITATTASTSTTSGAIQTSGGIGLKGALNVGGTALISGLLTASGAAAVNGVSGTTALQVTGVGASPARLYLDFQGGGTNYIDGPTIFRTAGGGATIGTFGSGGLTLASGATLAFGTFTSGTATNTGYITITDAGGTTRHLAVVP